MMLVLSPWTHWAGGDKAQSHGQSRDEGDFILLGRLNSSMGGVVTNPYLIFLGAVSTPEDDRELQRYSGP